MREKSRNVNDIKTLKKSKIQQNSCFYKYNCQSHLFIVIFITITITNITFMMMMMTKGEDSLPDDLAGRRPLRVIDGPSLSGHNHHRHDDGHDNRDDHDGDGYQKKECNVVTQIIPP